MTRLLVSMRFAPYSETEALAVRHGADAVELDGVYRESFGPAAFLAGGAGATIQDGHDSTVVGEVVVVAAASDGWYHCDAIVESNDPELIARCKPGQPVSVGCRVLTRHSDVDLDIRVKRHRLAQLEHLAIARPGERAGYRGAQIVSVRKLADRQQVSSPASSGVDWRTVLPREWAKGVNVRNLPADPPQSLLDDSHGREWRWDGSRFVATRYARAA